MAAPVGPRHGTAATAWPTCAALLLAALGVSAGPVAAGHPVAAAGEEALLRQSLELYRRGQAMDCSYPSRHQWWQSLTSETVDIVRVNNPDGIISAATDCLHVPLPAGMLKDGRDTRAVDTAVALLRRWVSLRDSGAGEWAPEDCMDGWIGENCDRCAVGHEPPYCTKAAATEPTPTPAPQEDATIPAWKARMLEQQRKSTKQRNDQAKPDLASAIASIYQAYNNARSQQPRPSASTEQMSLVRGLMAQYAGREAEVVAALASGSHV
eukprot:COSAG05_NODE_6328_length_979_cov_1.529545_1_plen_266_part_01